MSNILADENLRLAVAIADRFTECGLRLVLAIGQKIEDGDAITDILGASTPAEIKSLLTDILVQFDDGEVTSRRIPNIEDLLL